VKLDGPRGMEFLGSAVSSLSGVHGKALVIWLFRTLRFRTFYKLTKPLLMLILLNVVALWNMADHYIFML